MSKRSTWINWRPVTDLPVIGQRICVLDSDDDILTFIWDEQSEWAINEIAWVPFSELNKPKFQEPPVQSADQELVRKIKSLPEPAPEVVGKLVEQLRGYDKHLRVCMGWTMRASELEVSSGMHEAELADLKAAESFLANIKIQNEELK